MKRVLRNQASCVAALVAIWHTCIFSAGSAYAQGEVEFRNRLASVDAPIYDVDGVTPLFGSGFVAQLYAAPVGVSSLEPIGSPADFSVLPGYFFAMLRTITSVRPGDQALCQVRAWRLSDGETFEAAFHPGGHVGMSDVFGLWMPSGALPPTPLLGLESFSLYVVPVPEAGTGILGLVGLVVLAGGRKLVSRRPRRRGALVLHLNTLSPALGLAE